MFRSGAPRDLLASDSTQTRKRTAAVFQHTESEQLCIYLDEIDTLAQARKHSSLVRTVLEVLNEQLIKWHEENRLLVGASGDADSLLCFPG